MYSSTLLKVCSCLLLLHCCAAERFKFPSFLNRPHLDINGDAFTQSGDLVLVKEKNQVGTVWFDKKVEVSKGFFTSFTFHITAVDNAGGEGMAFVLQSDGSPYSIGQGGKGLGYADLGHGLAVELDTVPQEDLNDLKGPHLSVHAGMYNGLSATEGSKDLSVEMEDLLTYDSSHPEPSQRRQVTIDYDGDQGTITIVQSHISEKKTFKTKTLLKNAKIGALQGSYYVGFTAATGESFARFAVSSWYFQAVPQNSAGLDKICSEDFDGPNCAITNEKAEAECPRLESCNLCLEDVYNCGWCQTAKGGKCVVALSENTKECSSFDLEIQQCSASLSHIWLYMLVLAFFVILVFGVLLYKYLPAIQSFRAISLLVALVGGALSGMFVSYVISVSLVAISETPVFSVAYGLFFAVQCFLISTHIFKVELPSRGWLDSHVIMLCVCNLFVFISALSCFLLDKRFIHWLPEGWKILFYTTLGGSLNFCLVFSLAEVCSEISMRCSQEKYGRNITSSYNNAKEKTSIISSQARIALLAAGSIVSGMWFGLVFGTLRIEEESKYRVALSLQQESAFTYPVGAAIGGIGAMLYQLIQLPYASDDQIDRIIRTHAGDDL